MSKVADSGNAANGETVEKTYTYFDAELEQKSEKVTVTFVPPKTLEEAMTRVNNNADVQKEALTAYLRRASLKEARGQVLSKGISKKVVLDFIKAWREFPQYASIKERKDQTAAILGDVKKIPQLVEMLKAKAAADTSDADDEDDE